ncbi:MAG: PLP-dependent transferase [Burkholderiaceae bacterium]
MKLLSLSTNLGDTKRAGGPPRQPRMGALTPEQRTDAGVSQDLIRVAMGLEHLQDISTDLDRGLSTF